MCWPMTASLGQSFFMIMKLYGIRRKSDTLAFVKKFLADISGTGVPRSFRMDNGGEFVSRDFIAFCNNAGIRRTYTAPGTPQQNGPAESAIWRVNKAGHAARLEARRLFPKIDFTRVPDFGRDAEGLWLESCHWATGGFNRPRPRQTSVLCCYLNNGDDHHESVVKVLKLATGRVCMTNNVVWASDRTPLPTPPLEMPAPADEGGDSDVAAAPFLIEYISPPLLPPSPFARYPNSPAAISSQAPPATSTPPSPAAPSTAATPSPPVTAPPATPPYTTTAPPATPPYTTTAPRATPLAAAPPFTTTAPLATPFAVVPPRRHLQDKATLLSTLTTRSVVDRGRKEIPSSDGGLEGAEPGGRERGAPKQKDCVKKFHLRAPHCYANDLRVPKTYRKAVSSQHADLWVDSVEREFRGLMEAAMACKQNLSLRHFDIKQAFVQSDLDEDIFMLLPEECGRLSGMIVKLNKSLYGLKRASRQWHSHLATWILKISQQTYAEELVMEFGVEYGKEVPLPVGLKLSEFDQVEEVLSWPFRELIGSLMWLATQTRPDIANAVRAVARYCASPKEIHWRAGLGILGYVVRTSDLGISFRRGSVAGLSMEVFADADYASKAADRRSVSGGLVMCGGGCSSWFSRTQKCVTLSRTVAEYVSLADVMKEVLFLEQVWRFMFPVFEDNQGAIHLAQNPISSSNSKHIDVRHHFIRELVSRKEISIFDVESAYQHADFLTKALHVGDFEFHRNFVMSVGQER
ncbi:unnamed protein product [Ectocarpus sp. CCAP 1310/34]|nr:unnamed protein product [Ectocarpus sp. CCAP 1310/34]